VRGHSLRAENARALLNNFITMVVFTVFGVLMFGAQPLLAIDAGILAAFIVTLLFIRAPIGITIDAIPVVLRLRHSLHKLEQLELASQEGWARRLDKPVAIVRPERLTLRAREVSYRFADVNGDPGFAIGPCSFELNSGQAMFVVGGNGSGKSTLAHILAGLYLPQAGALSLNGISIGRDNLEWYRSQVGVIFSDFCLFDFAVGPQGDVPPTQQVDEWLHLLELHHKVRIEHGIVSTTDLSHGQRKRLALLAAYVESKPILVLDEWAADQDPSFKAFFYTELLSRMKREGKMLIVITHDERYFHLADSLYQMKDGSLHARLRPAAVAELPTSITDHGEVLHVQ
jgi:putative ATP-binding cassette transporter